MKYKKQIIACDVDGTLCREICWTPEEVERATPNKELIKMINELFDEHSAFVIIYTARRDRLIPSTLEWLRMHGVKFHAFSNRKIPCDLLIDDKTVHPDDFLVENL